MAHQPGWWLCECCVTILHPVLQLMPLKLHSVTFVCRFCAMYCITTLHISFSLHNQISGHKNSLVLKPGCISQGLEPYWSKRSDVSRPFPPVHHGSACLSQKSLTTTNISSATACLSLISCRGDIFRVSKPLWRGKRTEPIPQPYLPHPSNPLTNYSPTCFVHFSLILAELSAVAEF